MVTRVGVQPSFRVLGQLEVIGVPRAALGGPKQRALLVYLLLHANELVARDRLIDAVWGDEPPPTAAKVVQQYVAKLRGELAETAAQITTRSPGYVLELEPDELDLRRFERLAQEGRAALRAGEPRQAVVVLDEALAFWRGEAFADLAYEPVVREEASRLETLLLEATLDRLEAGMELGELPIAELERLVARHPYEERLRGLLILALYRAGRQTDALAAYQTARRTLVSEIGVEPGPALRRLEQAILDHDPDLAPPAPPVSEPAATPRRRFSLRLVTVLVVVAVAVAAVTAVLITTRGPSTSVSLAPNSVGLVDPVSGRILKQVSVGEAPAALSAAYGTLWSANRDGESVTRIDERTGRSTTIPLGGHPTAIAADRTGAWVEEGPERRLVRVSGEFDRVTLTRPHGPGALLEAAGALWTTRDTIAVEERDLQTGALRRSWTPDLGASTLAYADQRLWLGGGPALTPFDPRSHIMLSPVALAGQPTVLAANDRTLWAAVAIWGGGGWTLQRVDARLASVTGSTSLGADPLAVAVADGVGWVAAASERGLLRVDGAKTQTIRLGATPTALAVGELGVWVAVS